MTYSHDNGDTWSAPSSLPTSVGLNGNFRIVSGSQGVFVTKAAGGAGTAITYDCFYQQEGSSWWSQFNLGITGTTRALGYAPEPTVLDSGVLIKQGSTLWCYRDGSWETRDGLSSFTVGPSGELLAYDSSRYRTSWDAGVTFGPWTPVPRPSSLSTGATIGKCAGSKGAVTVFWSDGVWQAGRAGSDEPLQWVGGTHHLPLNGEIGNNDDIRIYCETWPAGSAIQVELVYSLDGGVSWLVAPMATDGPKGNNDGWMVNLGSFPYETTIQYVVVADDSLGTKLWDNDGGSDYLAEVNPATLVHWFGNSYHWPEDGQIRDTDDLWINAESGPLGAALEANVVYSVDAGVSWQVAPMSYQGQSGENDTWSVNFGSFELGTVVQYALWAVDEAGADLWDNNGGSDYFATVDVTSTNVVQSPEDGALSSADDLVVTLIAGGDDRGYQSVDVVYSLDGKQWVSVPLVLTVEETFDRWEVNLGQFAPGTIVQYALVGTNPGGSQYWYNNTRWNYRTIVASDATNLTFTGPNDQVTVSSESSSYWAEWKAFDGELGSSWSSGNQSLPAWIGYEFDVPTYVDSYLLLANYYGAPKEFEFQGYNGSDWVTLDARSGETEWHNEWRSYSVANPGSYTNYRLWVSSTLSSGVGIAEIRLVSAFDVRDATEGGEFSVVLDVAASFESAEVQYSLDGGTWLSAGMARVALDRFDRWEANLGAMAPGTAVSYRVVGIDAAGNQRVFDDYGMDFTAEVTP